MYHQQDEQENTVFSSMHNQSYGSEPRVSNLNWGKSTCTLVLFGEEIKVEGQINKEHDGTTSGVIIQNI